MSYLEIAKSLALKAGKIMSEGQRKGFEVREKSLADFVTNIDIEIEEMVRKELKALTPDFLILGEEAGEQDWSKYEQAEYCWILDPLDGTSNYASRLPHFAFSLGLVKNSKPILGVVFDTREMFFAEEGKGAFVSYRGFTTKKISVSSKENSKNSMLAIGVPDFSIPHFGEKKFWYLKFVNNFGKIRSLGASALDIAWLADGRIEAFFQESIKPWDVAAAGIIASEAGAVVKSLDKSNRNKLVDFSVYSGDILVCNPLIYKSVFSE